jgi:flagellin
MALMVNKNISALQAHGYLKQTENSFSKAVEKLSSGMKINRAADDPAGLVISEKYRAQVDGLKQAIKNSQDGISLVQTAEASLDETTTVLRTMRNLALHAASTGTSDSEAVAADQAQISKAIQTLDRIANTTAFGTRKLLDGSSGVSGTTTDSSVSFIQGNTATQSGTYAVDITTAAVQGEVKSAAAREYGQVLGAGGTGATSAAGGETLTFGGTQVNGGVAVAITAATGDGVNEIAAKINNNSALQAAGITATVNGNNLKINAEMGQGVAAGEMTVQAGNAAMTNMTGIANAAATQFSAGKQTADDGTLLHNAETMTFKNGAGSYVQVALTKGQTIGSAITQLNNALDSAGIKVTASFTAGSFSFKNDDYGSSTNVTNTISSSLAGAVGNTGVGAVANTHYNIANAGAGVTVKTDGADVAGRIGTYAATGKGQILTGSADTPVEGLQVKYSGTTTGSKGTVTVEQHSLNFQIGAFDHETVNLSLGDMRTNMLGTAASGTTSMTTVNIASLDVTTEAGAQDAIRVIDAAISQVSSTRSEMGSFQKDVLESTVRNLGVAATNMSASESQIRDADMAEEMLSFSRAQILQSTGMAMLAQANQAPQSIMKLFG